MFVGRKNWMDFSLKVDHNRFKKVNFFKYLSSIVSEKYVIIKEVDARI